MELKTKEKTIKSDTMQRQKGIPTLPSLSSNHFLLISFPQFIPQHYVFYWFY